MQGDESELGTAPPTAVEGVQFRFPTLIAELSIFILDIKIARLHEISKLIWVSILIGNPPYVF